MAELNSSSGQSTGKHRTKKLATRVDLTAMVDLAFLLITFFMLTTGFMKPKSFELVMPDKSGPENIKVSDKRTMTIVLGNHNEVVSYLGMTQKPLTEPTVTGYGKDGIRKAIIEASKMVAQSTGKSMFVIIKPSDHSVYGNMVNALDEVHIAGVDSYAITDITPAEVLLLKQKGIY